MLKPNPNQIFNSRAVSPFIPALDGLRGIAVLAVLLFHLGIPQCSLGWAGVELFFVISGFLITRILINTRDDPNYFKKFYYRRALRIFPIYYLVIIGFSGMALFASGGTLRTLPFYYMFLQTIPQLQSRFTDLPLLGHTWSLAIEEQFYLIWPLVVFLLRKRRLFVAICIMIGAALIMRFVALVAFDNPFLVDGWLGVQVDSLAAGAMVAYSTKVFSRKRVRRWMSIALVSGVVGLSAILCIAGTSVFWSPTIWCRAWYGPLMVSVMACTFAGAVGLVTIEHQATRWLESRFLMGWGKISYGIYLFHPFTYGLVSTWALSLFVHKSHPAAVVIIIAKLLVTYLVARISWKIIENPINRLKDRPSIGFVKYVGAAEVIEARQSTAEPRPRR